jgi:hypothetical protein
MKRLIKKEESAILSHASSLHTLPAGMEASLPAELRALAAVIVNMLARHTHGERQAVLRFALEKEKQIPVQKTSVFSGTSIMPGEPPAIR